VTLALAARNALGVVKQKSPVILTGLAIGGVVTTTVLAVQATPRAIIAIDEDQEDGTTLTKWEVVKKVWPYYIPVVITGGLTIACMIGAQSVNTRRQAALVGAFTITEGAFQEYKEQVVEVLGKTKESSEVREKIIQKKIEENPPSKDIIIGSGNVLCFDTYTGRYFESSMEKIRAAQNDFNEMLINGEMYMSANEFYHLIDLDDVVVGEQVGFSPENTMKIEFTSRLTPDGRPCLAISFRALPRQDYRSMFQ
jgi:hypothetical protein